MMLPDQSGQRNLPGLTPAWLITLAAVLAFLVGLAGEAFQRGIYEFLKDFQTAIIGTIAFVTAVWAARPVFGQLDTARRQASVVAYEALSENLASLTEEQLLIDDIDQAIFSINFEWENVETATSVPFGQQWQPDAWRENIEEKRRAIDSLRKTFRTLPRRPWGSNEVQRIRRELTKKLRQYSLRIRICSHELKVANGHFVSNTLSWANLVQAVDSTRTKAASTDLEDIIVEFVTELLAEQQRLRTLIEASYGEFAPNHRM